MSENNSKRCAVVGVVGRTNSGKSTLVNRIVGEKVSIVSPVEQTTRNTVRGILTEARGQLVFLDTPGLHKAEGFLGTLLNRMARQDSAGVDVLLVVFDAAEKPQIEDDGWMRRARRGDQPAVFVLNKKDCHTYNPKAFRDLWQQVCKEEPAPAKPVEPIWIELAAILPGCEKPVLDKLFTFAQPSADYLFPEDIVTDYPRKLAIADCIREKFLARLREDLPHEIGVFVENLDESEKAWDVTVTIYVNQESQKRIVIGKGGDTIKYVRQCAEKELTEIYETHVSLSLWVKVEKNWMANRKLLQQMGYLGLV